MEQKICELGCGKIAIHQLKSGKWICDTSANKCEVMRKKNSDATLGIEKPWMRGENHPRPMLGKKSWNSGLTKETSPIVMAQSNKMKGTVSKFGGRASTAEKEKLRKENISKSMKGVGGGFRMKSGRGKKGWYKGYFCSSSWELAWVIYSLEHGVKFERNKIGFPYEFNGKRKKYYPDFIVDKNYVEIKGYDSPQWEEKKKQFNNNLIVLGKNEIKPYIEYTETKYGKDFVRLYEDGKVAERSIAEILKISNP
jgi:hypothetical protein